MRMREKVLLVVVIMVIISFFFIYHPPEPSRIYEQARIYQILIITDENISAWQDETCTCPLLEINWEEIKRKRIDTIVFYLRNDCQYPVIATWEDNIYGNFQNIMKYWDEKNGTWWLWPEYVSEGPNYGLYFKPGQVFKVKYELGPVLPMRISIWSVKYSHEE